MPARIIIELAWGGVCVLWIRYIHTYVRSTVHGCWLEIRHFPKGKCLRETLSIRHSDTRQNSMLPSVSPNSLGAVSLIFNSFARFQK